MSSSRTQPQYTSYYTAVQNILSFIDKNKMVNFSRLQSDEDRFRYVSSLDFVKKAFRVIHPSTSSPSSPTCSPTGSGSCISPRGMNKSSAEAGKLRQKGNKLFTEGKLEEALNCYNRCVILAPPTPSVVAAGAAEAAGGGEGSSTSEDQKKNDVDDNDDDLELSLALGNRSACLLQMRKYTQCLDDIKLALHYHYPMRLRYKIFDRMGRALLELSDWSAARDSFNDVIAHLKHATALDKKQSEEIEKAMKLKIEQVTTEQQQQPNESIQQQLQTKQQNQQQKTQQKREGEAAVDETKEPVTTIVPQIAGETSDRFPSASDSFEVRYSTELGRYGVTSRNINVGDVIIVESPHVAVLNDDSYNHRCYHCFRALVVPYACHQCTTVRYCSESCRQESWDSYHATECSVLDLLLTSDTGPIARLALRLLIATGLKDLMAHKHNPKTSTTAAQQSIFTGSDGSYVGGFASLYSLLTHSTNRPITDLLQYTILAVWLLRVLQLTDFFDDLMAEDYVANDIYGGSIQAELDDVTRTVGGTLLRFLQIISCNGVEVMEMAIGETLHKSQPISIGLALYPTVSLLNHSCDPVLELIFYHQVCVARAIQSVDVGQELSIDYGYVFYTTARDQRQTALKAQYFFDCSCTACTADWPLVARLRADVPQLRCGECAILLPPLVNYREMLSGGAGVGAGERMCPGCALSYDPMDYVAQLYCSQTRTESAISEARKFHIRASVPVLESHMQLMHKCIVLPWKDYVTCMSTLKQCYRMMGNRRRR